MKIRPKGFISEDKLNHNGEVFDYIRELHTYLWRFIYLFNPGASGTLDDWIDDTLDDAEARCSIA